MPNDQLVPNYVERPSCGHMQTIMARPALNLSDYNTRLVPELKEAIKGTCDQCAQLAKQKLVQEMQEKARK